MTAETPERLDLRSHDVIADRRESVLELFPEARTEGGAIDFERLRLALGDRVDVGRERYGLTWPGKAECFRAIQTPSLGTLRPARDESVNFDTTENVIIEGDNLEVLKLLQKSYLGKVKMIYIDPPYNTGHDFIYPDDYNDTLRTYLAYTGQTDAHGRRFGDNPEGAGRFHSNWLNMMYPRLYLARNLLRDDGVIFVSINDAELVGLRAVLDGVFGGENWLGTIVWNAATDNNPTRIAVEHEYIVCFARDTKAAAPVWTDHADEVKRKMLAKYAEIRAEVGASAAEETQVLFRRWIREHGEALAPLTHYNRVDEFGPYTGSRKVHNPKPGGYAHDVVHPRTRKVCVPPVNGYRYPPAKMDELVASGKILFGDDETQIIQIKEYLADFEAKLSSLIELDSRVGANELGELFEDRKVFTHPKPSALIRHLASFCLEGTDLILDFFAGSGTTAHAVLNLNSRDGGQRRFILVQLPEPTGRDDYKTISDITKERVRRVGNRLNNADAESLNLGNATGKDRGFRVFKLAESNFKAWDAAAATTADALAAQLELHVHHVRDDRSADDLLFEVLLKSGFTLTAPVEELTLAGKRAHLVRGRDGDTLLVCLERNLTIDAVREMAAQKPKRVVCLDEGFHGNDQLKVNAAQTFKSKGVTSFKTV
ncbi:MAG TPA: site-specific DNA-methyltransferase [Gemmatimonadaceae bacterium]|nr:site-specific DNA-methyltransferase [Gemmatimonadaceae bacterium]